MKCEEKKVFRKLKEAWAQAAYVFVQYGTFVTAYHCYQCKKYHLTSKRPKNHVPNEYFDILEKYLRFKIPEVEVITSFPQQWQDMKNRSILAAPSPN